MVTDLADRMAFSGNDRFCLVFLLGEGFAIPCYSLGGVSSDRMPGAGMCLWGPHRLCFYPLFTFCFGRVACGGGVNDLAISEVVPVPEEMRFKVQGVLWFVWPRQ